MNMRNLAIGLILCSTVFAVSCTDENSKNAYRYEILKALDRGDYDKVIELLENNDSYKKAFSIHELNINLAAAYIGKAGYDISSIINDILDSDADADAFKLFSQAISKKVSGSSLKLLNKAVQKYSEILQGVSCEDTENLSELQKDACFLKGLVETAKGANSFVLALEENPEERDKTIENWINGTSPCSEDDVNANGTPDDLEATACAIEYANSGTCSIPNSSLLVSSVTFSDTDNNYSYTLLSITINPDISCTDSKSNKFYRLISDTDVIITDGYCDLSFSPCNSPDGINCLPCPVIDNQESLTVEDTIINTINNGIDTILSVVPDQRRSDVEENLREFKQNICLASPPDCICDGVPCIDEINVQNATDLQITEEALAKYLKQ